MAKITERTWFSASGTCGGCNFIINIRVNFGSSQKKTLAKGLSILIGECVFALNGPFLFNRFGLNVPEAAAVGCLVGLAVGYWSVDLFLRIRNR